MKNRLPKGGMIDRSKLIKFSYDGKKLYGFEGDSLASALIANGIFLVGRSFKYHRPRGILSAGTEEPNALVQLEKGAYSTPNIQATVQELYPNLHASSQNCFPSVKFDLGAFNSKFSHLLPSGFYYKTFMWPAKAWKLYEYFIRKMAGLGFASGKPDPDRYELQHDHPDLVIVGGGIAGLVAAEIAAKSGAKIVLIEQQHCLGGSLLFGDNLVNNNPLDLWCQKLEGALAKNPNVKILKRTTAFGYYNDNYLVACERLGHHLSPKQMKNQKLLRERIWHFHAKHILLATGAVERPLVYANNDIPGTMLASAVGKYIRQYGVLAGQDIIFATNNDFAYRDAITAHHAGANVTICDIRELSNNKVVEEARKLSIRVYDKTALVQANGKHKVQSVYLASVNDKVDSYASKIFTVNTDIVAISAGYTPSVHLHSQSRGTLKYSDMCGAFIPDSGIQDNDSLGSAGGTFGIQDTINEAQEKTLEVLKKLGFKLPKKIVLKVNEVPISKPLNIGEMPHQTPEKVKCFIDFQNDSTANDIRLAMREGMESIEHVKRYTTTGMATDQGKTSNINALEIVARAQSKTIEQVGYTTYRQPYTPVTFGAIAGAHRDHLFLPDRRTAIDGAHQAVHAKFEPVGDWMRAWYYPYNNRDILERAVYRESLSVRKEVGMFDASTLGKIDIQGKDAVWLLNMLYTNAWDKLAVGRCRYGIMLNEHGMIIDDGVTTKLAENHYHMTTTTGGAARIMDWIELWLQTEWPEKQVYATSVTEQWAVVAIAGPDARNVLAKLTDLNLDNESFPFMSMQETTVANIPAKIYRITFSGELCYEINVPARYGMTLWQAIKDAGHDFRIIPYGTETMHVLRAEKGFIIVGQDTDGSRTPADMNLNWIVSKKKNDFLGKRALTRSDMVRPNRKQLVGLLVGSRKIVIPEGSQITANRKRKPPYKMIGYVSSSYDSPTLKRGIALALVENGLNRMGEKVYIPLANGKIIKATITDSVFYDKEGKHARS